jgi:predicted amidohydrolase YtcJ
MEGDLEPVIRLLAEHRWPWRLHATYDQTISRALDVYEKVNRDIPLTGINWFFDHAETISDRNIDRIAALGGGIAVQHRMAYQGEYFVERYGHRAAERTPPIARMIAAGIPVGAGTDATRVASYNPWVSLSWLVTGRTVGGMALYPGANRVSAKRRWPCGRTRTPGFPAKWARRARSSPGNWPIARCSAPITSPCPSMTLPISAAC